MLVLLPRGLQDLSGLLPQNVFKHANEYRLVTVIRRARVTAQERMIPLHFGTGWDFGLVARWGASDPHNTD